MKVTHVKRAPKPVGHPVSRAGYCKPFRRDLASRLTSSPQVFMRIPLRSPASRTMCAVIDLETGRPQLMARDTQVVMLNTELVVHGDL